MYLATQLSILHSFDIKIIHRRRYRPGASAPAAGHVRTYTSAGREFKFGARWQSSLASLPKIVNFDATVVVASSQLRVWRVTVLDSGC